MCVPRNRFNFVQHFLRIRVHQEFAAKRFIMSLMLCDATYDGRSSDLSGAFLGTGVRDTSGYMRQPAGKQDADNIIRLMKPCHGL